MRVRVTITYNLTDDQRLDIARYLNYQDGGDRQRATHAECREVLKGFMREGADGSLDDLDLFQI